MTITIFGINRLISKNQITGLVIKVNNNTLVIIVNVLKVINGKRQYFTGIFL